MSFTNTVETDVLELIFNATTWDNFAENDSTSPATTLYVSLHTANPGEAGTQQTSEATYGSYARQGVARTSGGWTISGNIVNNAAAITFPEATSGSETVTYIGVGQNSSGAGDLYMYAQLDNSRLVESGVQPAYAIGQCNFTLD